MSSPRCPYCRADLAAGLVSVCDGCPTIYHLDCARELRRCGTLGCGSELVRRQPLEITGRSVSGFDSSRLLAVLFLAAFLPALGVLAWVFFRNGMLAWGLVFVTLALVMSCAVGGVQALADRFLLILRD